MRRLVMMAFVVGAACGGSRPEDSSQPDAGVVGQDAPVDGPQFEVRVLDPMISADGHSKVPVLVLGTDTDGTPVMEQVVLNTSRPGTGTFSDPAPTLGAFGATVYFTPCNYTTPGCTGPVDLTLALASEPTKLVTMTSVELIMPTGVGSATPCLVGGDVMFFDGNDYIYNGMMTVTQGMFGATGTTNRLAVDVTPSMQGQGLWWDLVFSTAQLGTPLTPGIYEMAQREPFAQPGHPGLSVTGDGRGCNTISGRFQIHEYTSDENGVARATASFEQHCEGGTNVLNGCIHFER